MKTLTLSIGKKLYTSGKITAWQAREAIAVNKEALRAKNAGDALPAGASNLDKADAILSAILEISNRKANLICDAFGKKFTADELEQALSTDEIDEVVSSIISGVGEIITKN